MNWADELEQAWLRIHALQTRLEDMEADMRYILDDRTHLWQIKERAARALAGDDHARTHDE